MILHLLFTTKQFLFQDRDSDQDEKSGKHGLELGSLGWPKTEKKEIVMENHNIVQFTETC